MGTWTPGVAYTDNDPDQITDEVNTDRQTQGEVEAGLGISELPTIDVEDNTRITPGTLIVVEKDGVTHQVTAQQLGGFVTGTDSGRGITGSDTLTKDDVTILSTAAGAHNLAVCHLDDEEIIGHLDVTVVALGTGQLTVTSGTASAVAVTGTGRAKTRAQFSVVRVRPLVNVDGTTVWTVYGDTANA